MQQQFTIEAANILRWCGAAALTLTAGLAMAGPDGPACSELGLATHGEHIIGDYVTGIGGVTGVMGWPPNGQVGEAVSSNGGALIPGGAGPGFHFPNGFAPGASAGFCNSNAHPNGFTIPGPFAQQ